MSNKTWYTALTGLLFFILVVIVVALGGGDFDATKDPVSEIAKSFDDSTKLYAQVILQMIAIIMLVWYGGHLRNALRESSVAPLITAGTAILAVGLAVDTTLSVALFEAFDNPDVTIAPGAIQALAI